MPVRILRRSIAVRDPLILGAMRTLVRTLTSTVFIAAAAGYVFAHYGSTSSSPAAPPPLNRQATAPNFSVSYPSSWHVASVRQVPQVRLVGVVSLAPSQPSSAQLVIGTDHSTQPTALPSALRARLATSPRPQVVTLGGTAYYRFLNLTPSGEGVSESLYALPTTRGTITAVCSATTPSVAFTSSCERVLATLNVTAGQVRAPVANAGYAFELNRIMSRLDAARSAAGSDLRSSDLKVRAAAAQRLAAADDRAATAAHHITTKTVSLANQPLESALRMNAAAYQALAAAAAKQDAAAYQQAETQISRSDRALAAVNAQLRSYGYKLG